MDVYTLLTINVIALVVIALVAGGIAALAARSENASGGETFLAFLGVGFAASWITFAFSTSVWVVIIVLHFVLKFW